jgi:hypothetical protein
VHETACNLNAAGFIDMRRMLDGAPAERKTDIRLYVYDGEILLTAARLYRGQATNFRMPGSGFAPVFVI